ncbi:MAG: ABC transporter ATP-binding protein [Clostridia bacterium]|nr:ABC transporter ATP-binding protein [Clostridia bacterium]
MNEEINRAKELNDDKYEFDVFSFILKTPESVLKYLLNDSYYNENLYSVEDKITLLKSFDKLNGDNVKEVKIPEVFANVLFKDFDIGDTTITSEDQYKFVQIFSSIDNPNDAFQIYGKIMELPDHVKKLIEPKMNLNKIRSITILLVCMYLLSALFSFIQSIEMAKVSNNSAKMLRGKISNKINRLPLKYFDRHQTGDILSRVTNDVDTIAQSMNQSLGTLVTATTLFLGSIIMMVTTNWLLALTAILSSLFGFIGMSFILKKSQKYFVARQVELGRINAHIEEIFSGLNVVKAYNGRKIADKKFDELNQNVYDCNKKSQFLSGLMPPMMAFIGNFGYVAVCIVGALLTMKGSISFGVIVAFIVYVRLFTNPLSQIAQALTALQTTAAASERVFEFIDEEELDSEDGITEHLDKSKVEGKIEFDNVFFQYDNNDKPTIYNFTATANPGQKIAIVGPTGAGKTTMVNLLMKFYNIKSGDIRIDGVSTKNLSRQNIRELFTMVLQDTWLFEGTVKENIVYNKENVPDSRVEEVCKEVGLHHFIKTLPNGYDSMLSENDGISAGQKQLLTIARGMIEHSPFLILDEATSNVDTRTEELVQEAMDKLTKGRTSFIIAHRLSTIKNADLILVMQNGNIVEQGNHDELIKKNGAYAELYNSQFEL